jgi:predicted AlkP superfamily phosphohydrolase/phosphomutase
VEPGAEAEAVLDDLEADLRRLTDPETGEPLVEDVWRRDDLYHGPLVGRAPDLTFLPRDMRNKCLGTMDFTSHRFMERAYGNSGDHRMNGIFFMAGEGVRPGQRIEGANLIDVAPTILHHLGEGVPADFDGRVLEEALTEDEMAANPVRAAAAANPEAPAGDPGSDHGLTEEEMKEIRDRLKGIGYLG